MSQNYAYLHFYYNDIKLTLQNLPAHVTLLLVQSHHLTLFVSLSALVPHDTSYARPFATENFLFIHFSITAGFRASHIIIINNYHLVGLFRLTFIIKCISFQKLGYCVWNFVYLLFNTLFFHSSKSLSLNTDTFYLSLLSKIETSC